MRSKRTTASPPVHSFLPRGSRRRKQKGSVRRGATNSNQPLKGERGAKIERLVMCREVCRKFEGRKMPKEGVAVV